MPNLILSAAEGKPKYKGNTHDLCAPAKKQIADHFFDDSGKRNRRSVDYAATIQSVKDSRPTT